MLTVIYGMIRSYSGINTFKIAIFPISRATTDPQDMNFLLLTVIISKMFRKNAITFVFPSFSPSRVV